MLKKEQKRPTGQSENTSNIYLRRTKKQKENNFLPIKILQSNDRVAEVQTSCDYCGKLIKTSMISMDELETRKNSKVTCWQCKQPKTSSHKL